LFESALFIGGATIAWAVVLGLRRYVRRLRLIDVPNQRSMHSLATPRGGGVAIVALTLIGIGIGAMTGIRPEWPAFGGYLGGSLLVVGVSLVDDFSRLSSGVRLALHFAGAAVMLAGLAIGLRAEMLTGQSNLVLLVSAAALLWTVGMTNAYNFMDGIDGLAATEAIVAGLGWTLLGTVTHLPWLALLGLLLAASSTGFLIHNWPPAKIFMGDVGSAFLGFTFAFMALAELPQNPQAALVGALLLWPFIFDTAFTMVRRFLRGENIFLAHRSHLYQRLVLAGWHQASVTALYGLFALVIFALGATWLLIPSGALGYLLIAVFLLLPIVIWSLVVRAEQKVTGPRDARPLLGRGR
jgi:UDP-N-acetylmuramyl pentapeptide phosphotransferase/UDP-N-acetylglucosamine-1-phosphate transferase